MEGVDRWVPSANDIMLNYQEAVSNEDRLRVAAWDRNAGPDPAVSFAMKVGLEKPASRADLLSFARTADFRTAFAKDPQAKAAMRRVKDRILSLKQEGMQIVTNSTVEPNAGSQLLNQRVREPVPHEFFMSSTLNPLESSHPTRGWDPRARAWPGRNIGDHVVEPTSYWCVSWVPGEKALDTEARCVRPQDITPEARAAKQALHGKAFR